MTLRLLLDTNVFVSAAISGKGPPAQLLRDAEAGNFTLVVSPLLLEELTDVLERPKLRAYLSPEEARLLVTRVRVLADQVDDPAQASEPITADTDDDFLVVLAEAERVDGLVSGDPHLTTLDREGMAVLTPREAVDLVLKREPRPPRTEG